MSGSMQLTARDRPAGRRGTVCQRRRARLQQSDAKDVKLRRGLAAAESAGGQRQQAGGRADRRTGLSTELQRRLVPF